VHQRVGTLQQLGHRLRVVHVGLHQVDGGQHLHMLAVGQAAGGHHQAAGGVLRGQVFTDAAAHEAGAAGDDDLLHGGWGSGR
jgi:hypothetical protein